MKTIKILLVVLLAAAAARADVICEQWGGEGMPVAHPKTMQVSYVGDRVRLVFDLSALPPDTTVYSATLLCGAGGQPVDPAVVHVTEKLDADGTPAPGGKPLELQPPLYRAFDVTDPVKKWIKDPRSNLGFVVLRFDKFLSAKTVLEIKAKGKPGKLPQPVAGVKAVHHHGQTFVRWQEVADFRPKPEEVVWISGFTLDKPETMAQGPGKNDKGEEHHPAITLRTLRRLQGMGLRDKPGKGQGLDPLRRVREVPNIRYRVYRHTDRITPKTIAAAERIGEAAPLSGFEEDVYNCPFQGEWFAMWEDPKSLIITWCYEDNKPLAVGETLYVHSPKKAGRAFYAVTTVLDGVENMTDIGAANSVEEPVEEKPAPPTPVLQLTLASPSAPEYWYRYWAGPPYYHLPDHPFRVIVKVPNLQPPRSLYLMNCIDGDSGHCGLYHPAGNAVSLGVDTPPLFYNEGLGTLRGVNACKVDYFGERFLFNLINWVAQAHQVDPKRITQKMSLFGIRHPELFSLMHTTEYTDTYDLFFAPGGSGLQGQLGPRGIKTVDGEDAWDIASIARYMRAHPERDVPFLICASTTGKDGGHTSEFGWQDDPRGWAALRDTRQPYVACWSMTCSFPTELTAGLNAMKWDGTVPAFSNCSLDNNPGNGEPTDGDYNGAINAWLLWQENDRVDEAGKWEMTVFVIKSCMREACTVDITPRHCRNFKAKAGQKFKWTNTRLSDNKPVQNGVVEADKWNLVTLPNVSVCKGKNRIKIEKEGAQ